MDPPARDLLASGIRLLLHDWRASARASLARDFGLGPAAQANSAANQPTVAKGVDARETATRRADDDRRREVEVKGSRLPKLLGKPAHQSRRRAAQRTHGEIRDKVMNFGNGFGAALREARKDLDTSLQNYHLATQRAVSAPTVPLADDRHSRSPRGRPALPPQPPGGNQGAGRGMGKRGRPKNHAKRKGKRRPGSKSKDNLLRRTPDGRNVCFAWNN